MLLKLLEIFPGAKIFTSVYNKNILPQFKDFKIETSFLNRLPYGKTRPQIYIGLMPSVFESFDLADFDLVISNTHACSKGVITKPDTLHLCYCHTPTRYLWLKEVDSRMQGSSLKRWAAHCLRIWDFQAAQRPDKFLANSKTVAKRIKKYYRRKAKVIYPPVPTSLFQPVKSANQLKDYFLFVSRLVAYKKPDLVIQAFNELTVPLKIIGAGPEYKRLRKLSKKNVEFLGGVSFEELRKHYAVAQALIFPAYEDFGMVAVEAMASGRPVIAYKKGGLTEIVKEGATGIFFDKQTKDGLKEAILRFKSDDYKPSRIIKEAKKFDEGIFKKKFLAYTKEEINKFLISND